MSTYSDPAARGESTTIMSIWFCSLPRTVRFVGLGRLRGRDSIALLLAPGLDVDLKGDGIRLSVAESGVGLSGCTTHRTLPDSVLTYWEVGYALAQGTIPATSANMPITSAPNATDSVPITRR